MPEGWGDDDKGDVDMQVTFSAGLSESKTDETTLDTYQRKMREKRKKKKADRDRKTSNNDNFFESDSEREDRRPVARSEELALLASGEEEPKHFDMKAILKSEKKTKRKGKHKETNSVEETETQDDFSIDVLDERFKAVHEDHNFAIDPSNPQCVSSMQTFVMLTIGKQFQEDQSHDKTLGRTWTTPSQASGWVIRRDTKFDRFS